MSISRSVVICSFIFFLLSKSYVYSQNLLETATSFLQIARNGESPDACRAALDRIYEELPQTSFEKVTPGDVDTLPNILQMAFFGSKPFSNCNQLLKKLGSHPPIDWTQINADG